LLSAFINFPFAVVALSHRHPAIIALRDWVTAINLRMFATTNMRVEATKKDAPDESMYHDGLTSFLVSRIATAVAHFAKI
jgi:hypothetical protein